MSERTRKPWAKAFGNPYKLNLVHLDLGFSRWNPSFAEVARVAPEIDCDVPDMAREDTDKLSWGRPSW